MASSVMFGHQCINPCPRTRIPPHQGLSWDPIANLAFSNGRNAFSFLGNTTRIGYHYTNTTQRNSFVAHANTAPGTPVPSGPPSSHPMSWVLGLVVSFILPFFSNKWGPLWVVKDKLGNMIQSVENIVEAVEEVAEKVDKIAGDIIDDLPEGKLRDLAELIEDVAEKTAKTADSLDDIIDKVQEAEDEVDDIISMAKKSDSSPPKEITSEVIIETLAIETKISPPNDYEATTKISPPNEAT